MSIGKLILHNRLSILSQFRVEIMCYNNLVVISPTHQLETSAGSYPIDNTWHNPIILGNS